MRRETAGNKIKRAIALGGFAVFLVVSLFGNPGDDKTQAVAYAKESADTQKENVQNAQNVRIDLADGTYEIAVTMSGGSGKASISSPTVMTVQDGLVTARIIFSSPNYDYMKVGEETFYPVNTEGNSTFEIPVTVFDGEMQVIADTTAMSTPHEITYTLYFDSSSLAGENAGTESRLEDEEMEDIFAMTGYAVGAVVGLAVIVGAIIYVKGHRKDA